MASASTGTAVAMLRTPEDEALIAAVAELIRHAPPVPETLTVEDIQRSLRRLDTDIPRRLEAIRLRTEARNG